MMQWQDEAIVIASQKYGEKFLLVHLLTKNHGVHAGLVRGVSKNNDICQLGNIVEANWQSRLEENLGFFNLEITQSSFGKIISDRIKLVLIQSACALVKKTLAEREIHQRVFDIFFKILSKLYLEKSNLLKIYIFFELLLLEEMGFGLDLKKCVITGEKNNLYYISPKTGHSVVKEVGEKYKDKLFVIPKFLLSFDSSNLDFSDDSAISSKDVLAALEITRFFLKKNLRLQGIMELPKICEQFLSLIKKC